MPLLTPAGHKGLRLCAQGLAHGGGHIVVRFKAALADGRAQGAEQILRFRAEGIVHGQGGFGRQTRRHAPPARVNGPNGPVHRVIEQNGAAVGGKDHQRKTGAIGDESVHIRIVPGEKKALAGVLVRDLADILRMGLLGENGALRRHAYGGAEASVVLPDIFVAVSPADAQVQAVPRGGADTAQTGGEAVTHRLAVQQGAGQPQQAVIGVGGKRHGGTPYK